MTISNSNFSTYTPFKDNRSVIRIKGMPSCNPIEEVPIIILIENSNFTISNPWNSTENYIDTYAIFEKEFIRPVHIISRGLRFQGIK